MKELSIFIDESGDFGEYNHHSPYYIITMIIHCQTDNLSNAINNLNQELHLLNLTNHCIHTGPIIRNEESYRFMTIGERRRVLNKMLSFIRDNYDYFLSYDKIKVYYDNGQIEVNKILSSVFHALFPCIEFRKVIPSQYKLFQVADLFCTFELLRLKLEHNTLSKSELCFFGNIRDLKKNYLKPLSRKEFLSH